ncbi:MAG: hypothetical protein HGB12_10590 [Bacteroidetes bacterium]|nr:hypothetical protein [Bacteroidota bacterium]
MTRSIVDRITGISSLHQMASHYSQNTHVADMIKAESDDAVALLQENKNIQELIRDAVKGILKVTKFNCEFHINKNGEIAVSVCLPKAKTGKIPDKDNHRFVDTVTKGIHTITQLKKSHIKVEITFKK